MEERLPDPVQRAVQKRIDYLKDKIGELEYVASNQSESMNFVMSTQSDLEIYKKELEELIPFDKDAF